MAKKPLKLKKTERESLAEAEEIARLYAYEGHDRVIERFNAIEGVEAPAFSEEDGWKLMSFCGVETRCAVSGQPLLDNWAAAARRALREAA